jgi:hypothetical protein
MIKKKQTTLVEFKAQDFYNAFNCGRIATLTALGHKELF